MRKKAIIYTVVVLALFFLFLIWFQATYSMDVIDSREVNSKEYTSKVLIASQGSEYKIEVVEIIEEHFEHDSVYIRITDVSALSKVSVDEYGAIVILHTWERFNPEKNAKTFLDSHYNKNKMFVISTSASGVNSIDGVDGITGASDLEKVQHDAQEVISWIEKRIN